MRENTNLLDESNQVTNFAEQEEENDYPPTLLANVDTCIIAFPSFILYRNNIYNIKLKFSPLNIY